MKFTILVVLLFTVISVYGQTPKAPAGSTAPAAAAAKSPKITTKQIGQMLTALSKILGPQMAKNIVSMISGGGSAGKPAADGGGGINQTGPSASGTGIGMGSGEC